MIGVILIVLISGLVAARASTGSIDNQNRIRLNYIIFISIVLILQSGLRNVAVGSDTYAYLLRFETTASWSWEQVWINFILVYIEGTGKDAGYILLEKIFQFFFNNYRMFLIAIAIFFFGAFGKLVYRNSTSITQVVFAYTFYLALFYAFFSITGHRQTIATAIVLYGFSFVQNKKLLKFLLCCFIAYFIHASVIVFVVMYPLYWFRNTKLLYAVSIIGILFVFVFRQQIINYTNILWSGEAIEGHVAMPLNFIAMMMAFFILIMYSVMKRSQKDGNKNIQGLCNIVLMGFLLAPTIGVESGTMRVVQYFSLFLVVLMPSIFNMYHKKIREIFYVMSITLFVFLAAQNTNYAFFWQPMQLGDNYGIHQRIVQK